MLKTIGNIKDVILLLSGWLLIVCGIFFVFLVNLYPEPSPIFVHIFTILCLLAGLALSYQLSKVHFLIPLWDRLQTSETFQQQLQSFSQHTQRFFFATDKIFFPLAGVFTLLFLSGYFNDDITFGHGLTIAAIYLVTLGVSTASALIRVSLLVLVTVFFFLYAIGDLSALLHLPKHGISAIVIPITRQLSQILPLFAAYIAILGFVFYQMATFFSDRHIHQESSEQSLDTIIITRRTITLRDEYTYKSIWKYLIGFTLFIAFSYFFVEYFFWILAGGLIIAFEF